MNKQALAEVALKEAAEKMVIAVTMKLLDGNSEQWMTKELSEAYDDLRDALDGISAT